MERLDAFMARANAAYYATHDPFADFTTAPEISQAFGELLGLWAAVVWQSMGAPDPVILAEAGPGRGTLMADALRATARMVPAFAAARRVHLIETSPTLHATQATRIPDAIWHDRADGLPPGPLLFLANEFLDALPIRQFVRRGDAWTERHVRDGTFAERPASPPPGLPGGGWGEGAEAPEATVLELCEPALTLVTALAARISQAGGAALFIDYGPSESAPGDSLQALRAGRPADPLADPGSADLTAHVDFQSLATAASAAGAAVHGPIPQGAFLTRLGLVQRTATLALTLPPARASAMMQTAHRLIEPDRMGRLFKAMAICHPALPSPPGFP